MWVLSRLYFWTGVSMVARWAEGKSGALAKRAEARMMRVMFPHAMKALETKQIQD